MNGQKTANSVLLFIYIVCFYISLGFPWNSQSGSIFGLNIGGFVIEPHLFLILLVLLPLFIFSGTAVQSDAMRRVLLTCKIISITCMVFFFAQFFFHSNFSGIQRLIMPIQDLKTWFLFWMMPVTILYVYDRGLERWLKHFFIATACYCVVSILALLTPSGWGANFISRENVDIYGRVAMENDIILVLAIPLVIAKLQDMGFSASSIVYLALYVIKLAMGQGRTLMAASGAMAVFVIIRSGRWLRSFLTLIAITFGIFLAILTLPEQQKFGLTERFTNLGEQAEVYVAMLVESNRIAIEQLSGARWFLGAGFGTPLELYGGAEEKKAFSMYVDNLWVTLLFKVGLIGFPLIGGSILWLCFSAVRGKPLSNVDRTFKFWAFLMPFLALRGSFLLFNNTVAGITWSTLAVATLMAEERRIARLEPLVTDEYLQDDHFSGENNANEFIT